MRVELYGCLQGNDRYSTFRHESFYSSDFLASAIGSIGRRRAVFLQTTYSAPAVNQPTKCKKKKKNNCVHFFAVADKNYNVFCSVFPKKFSSTR